MNNIKCLLLSIVFDSSIYVIGRYNLSVYICLQVYYVSVYFYILPTGRGLGQREIPGGLMTAVYILFKHVYTYNRELI